MATLQFHATRSEIASAVSRWVEKYALSLAFESFAPTYKAQLVDVNASGAELVIPDDVDRLVLNSSVLNLETASPLGLVANNPSSITLLVGRQTEGTLRESALAAGSNNPNWRPIRKDLLGLLRRGGRVVNIATGASRNLANHYWSPGAKALFDEGVKMTGIGPRLRYEFIE
jgi:hypothetical protein